MQPGFMPERGTIDTVIIFRRLKKQCHAKREMFYMYLVDFNEAVDRISKKMMECATRYDRIHVFVRSLMSLCEGANTRIIANSELP